MGKRAFGGEWAEYSGNEQGDGRGAPIANFMSFDTEIDIGVKVEVMESYDIKDDLKELGFFWNAENLTWDMEKVFVSEQESDEWTEWMIEKLEQLGCEIQ